MACGKQARRASAKLKLCEEHWALWGCDASAGSRSHYWFHVTHWKGRYRADVALCSEDGCERPVNGQGLCFTHYEQLPERQAKREAYRQLESTREKRRVVSRRRNKSAHRREWLDARIDWAAWWERKRLTQDRADIKAWQARQGRRERRIRRATRPLDKSRRFVGGWCIDCGAAFLDYAKRHQGSRYCSACAHGYQKRLDPDAQWEGIDPRRVFERDGYRCQICKRKTRGTWPSPMAPTVDHIVPRASGGDHTYENVQCAHWNCNARKGAGAANDQLRLGI